MVTAQELAVKIKSEGVKETRDNVEQIGESMEETAEQSGGAAEELVGFSEELAGAATAAVAGIALIAGGLLSQIPILGEFASGLGAIVSAIGLQIDQLLRDLGAGGLTNVLFSIANAIAGAEGALGDLAGVLGIVGSVIAGAITGIVGYAASVAVAAGEASAFIGVLKGVATGIASIVSGISLVTVGLAALVAAVAALAVAFITDFRGIRTKTISILGDAYQFIKNGLLNAASVALDAVTSFTSDVVSGFTTLASDLANWAAATAAKAFNWGVNIVTAIIEGIESFAQNVADALVGVINSVIGSINNILDALPDEISSRIGVEQFATISQQSVSADTPSRSGRARGSINRGGRNQRVTLDGRTLTESTGRYRSDPSRRRGL